MAGTGKYPRGQSKFLSDRAQLVHPWGNSFVRDGRLSNVPPPQRGFQAPVKTSSPTGPTWPPCTSIAAASRFEGMFGLRMRWRDSIRSSTTAHRGGLVVTGWHPASWPAPPSLDSSGKIFSRACAAFQAAEARAAGLALEESQSTSGGALQTHGMGGCMARVLGQVRVWHQACGAALDNGYPGPAASSWAAKIASSFQKSVTTQLDAMRLPEPMDSWNAH